MINISKGIVRVKGRRKIEARYKTTQTYIQFSVEHLMDFKDFRDHAIRQIAFLTQRRFKYAYKHLSKRDTISLVRTGEIAAALAALRNKDQAGCSLSKLQEKLSVDKMTASRALKGYTKKQINYSQWIPGEKARSSFRGFFDEISGNKFFHIEGPGGKPVRGDKRILDYRWSYQYDSVNDTYRVGYSLASTILVDPMITRIRN